MMQQTERQSRGTVRIFLAKVWLLACVIALPGVSAPRLEASEDTYILVAGRRLPFVYSVSLDAALAPANDGTPGAIVVRSKVALDRLDGRPVGDPANLVVSEDGETVYVVNHHGVIDNAEFRQHGGRGAIAVLDANKMLDPSNNRTANALLRLMDTGGFGALGLVLLRDLLVVGGAESHLTEDGGNGVALIDRRTGSLRHRVELALGSPGHACPDYPVPYVAAAGPPQDLAVLSPDPSFGCFPNPNGLARGRGRNGREYLFTANGGTDDVSVIDVSRALAGNTNAEIARIPTQLGPWGITATPDGRYVVVANGGSQRERRAGNSLSIIDVERASRGAEDAEIGRVLVGTDDPEESSSPLIPSVTPDGRFVVVPNVRAGNVSIVDLELALLPSADAEVARIPLTRRDGRPARPKGSAITADGRYALVSAGPRVEPLDQESGYLYVIDLHTRQVAATVTGVGNDPYGVALIYR